MLMYFDTKLAESYGIEEALMIDMLISLPQVTWAGTSNIASSYWQAKDTYVFDIFFIDFKFIIPGWDDKKGKEIIKSLVKKKALIEVVADTESYKVAFSEEMMKYLKDTRVPPKKKFWGLF